MSAGDFSNVSASLTLNGLISLGGVRKREVVFARRFGIPPRQISDTRLENAGRFRVFVRRLKADGVEPASRFVAQRAHGGLRNGLPMHLVINPAEEFARIGKAFRSRFLRRGWQ